MVSVCVLLPEPIVVPVPQPPAIIITDLSPTAWRCDGEEMLAIGYYRNVGVRADPDHVKHVLMSYIDDGDIHWGQTAWREMDEHTAREIAEGVWYEGSRVYFSAWS